MRQLCYRGCDTLAVADDAVWLLKPGVTPVRIVDTTWTFDGTSISCSPDGKSIAVLNQKTLFIHSFESQNETVRIELPRAANEARFTPDSKKLLIADKTGDAHRIDLSSDNRTPAKIVGHLSMLLDVLMSKDEKYVITCDRDEKIKVSNYPDTFDVRSFCLGHKEFVVCIELLPHNPELLLSASGDGTIKVWNFIEGVEMLSIDIGEQLSEKCVQDFKRSMKEKDIEVETLPINHMACCKIDEETSLIGLSNYPAKHILLYKIVGNSKNLKYIFLSKIDLKHQPDSFIINKHRLWILYHIGSVTVEEWDLNDLHKQAISTNILSKCVYPKCTESFLTLYKRKYDNVQEYQERKKQRLNIK